LLAFFMMPEKKGLRRGPRKRHRAAPDLIDVVSVIEATIIKRLIRCHAERRVHSVLDIEEVEITRVGPNHSFEERHSEASVLRRDALDQGR